MNQEKSNPTRTPYKILGISPDASMSEIENACQRAKLHCNPSNFEEDSPERERAIRRSEDITTAYAALTEEKMEPIQVEDDDPAEHRHEQHHRGGAAGDGVALCQPLPCSCRH